MQRSSLTCPNTHLLCVRVCVLQGPVAAVLLCLLPILFLLLTTLLKPLMLPSSSSLPLAAALLALVRLAYLSSPPLLVRVFVCVCVRSQQFQQVQCIYVFISRLCREC